MTRGETSRRIEEVGIIPVLRLRSADQVARAVDALLEGGLTVFEVTLTVPDALGAIRSLTARLGDRAIIGVGACSVPKTRARVHRRRSGVHRQSGPEPSVVDAALRSDRAVIPGALTPTERRPSPSAPTW